MQNIKSKITKFISIIGLVGLLALVTTACANKKEAASQSDKISIVTTTNVYSDIAKNIVGKYGTATAIIDKSSVDPHDFDPTTADAKKLTKANIIVANGLGYDSWMNKLAKSVNKKPVLVGEDLMGLKNGDNPHIWYNLNMPTKYVDYLVKRLSKLDKKHAAYFKANGKKYLAKVDKIKKLVKTDKSNKKPVFVSEPVFDYALKEAGYKIGFFVNNTQASSSTVKSFVKLAKKNGVPVLNVRETIPNHTTYLTWMKENYQNLANIENK